MVKKTTHSEFKRLNPSKVAAKYMSIPMASPDGLGLFVTPSPGCIWLISLISHEVRFQRGKKQTFKINIPIQIVLNVLTPASPSDIQTGTAEVLMSLIQLNQGSAWMTRKNKVRGRHRGICGTEQRARRWHRKSRVRGSSIEIFHLQWPGGRLAAFTVWLLGEAWAERGGNQPTL